MIGGIREAPGIGVKQSLSSGAGRSPPPTEEWKQTSGGVRSPCPTGATLVVRSSGPMYLRHGFRQPNFVPKFGASVIGIGPYALRGTARRGRRALRMVAESRRDCPGQRRTAERLRRGCEGWVEVGAEITPEGAINAGQSLSQPAADSSLYTREPLGTGDADCRVGPLGLLAMTMVSCHSEERSDVGIRSFLQGNGGVWSPRPTEASQEVPSNGPMWSSAPTGRRGSYCDLPGSALSAERVAGQIQVLPDN